MLFLGVSLTKDSYTFFRLLTVQQLLYEVTLFYYLHKVPSHEKRHFGHYSGPSQRLVEY